MKIKMTLQDLKNMFPPPSPHETPNRDGLTIRSRATQKRHRHNHKPVWLPGTPRVTPAQYRRLRK